MKSYRTYRYGELPYMCICNRFNKRDKQTKRMHQRTAMTGCDMHRYLEPMRKGSMQ